MADNKSKASGDLALRMQRMDNFKLAIRGQHVPDALRLPLSHLCVIHCIRYHPSYAI